MLKLANPGTVTDLVTEKDKFGVDRFLYLFLSFGASFRGFRRLRHVIVIDGTHLGGKFMGTLLTASGQDANFQVFPLAYAVFDSENNDSWTWFLEKLEKILADSSSRTIISDRCPSIKVAKAKIYPKAHHAACIVHLARNVTACYKSKGLAKMVISAAFQYRIGGFRKIYNDIRAASPDCARYLHKIGIAHWSRAHFPGDRYNLMTSNAAEQLNKALRGGRNSPILELLKFIQDMMTRWFNARRKKSLKHTGMCTPEVDKVLTANMEACKGSKINMVSSWAVQIVGRFGEKHQVLLRDRKCTCRVFDKLKIPCGHALMAADSLGLPYSSMQGDTFKPTAWVDTYEGIVFPPEEGVDYDFPADLFKVSVMPPNTHRPSGRPKETRIPSTGEVPVSQITSLSPLLLYFRTCSILTHCFPIEVAQTKEGSSKQVFPLPGCGPQQDQLQNPHLSLL
ncbi:unnamed protein product [Microthlaspi erraticum]|uniref:SWIM-type domain-containing protein n=1 Tax=Microthlaspi erraticum TaxID=1685480 RepID=A0A6D2IVR6_9BRAS|nr:unnamed protein product [Microthlaspi erraticum]